MPDKNVDIDRVGTGDVRFESERHDRMPLTEPEAAYRHREYANHDMPEIRSTQLIPGPLDEVEGPTLEIEKFGIKQNIQHHAK